MADLPLYGSRDLQEIIAVDKGLFVASGIVRVRLCRGRRCRIGQQRRRGGIIIIVGGVIDHFFARIHFGGIIMQIQPNGNGYIVQNGLLHEYTCPEREVGPYFGNISWRRCSCNRNGGGEIPGVVRRDGRSLKQGLVEGGHAYTSCKAGVPGSFGREPGAAEGGAFGQWATLYANTAFYIDGVEMDAGRCCRFIERDCISLSYR